MLRCARFARLIVRPAGSRCAWAYAVATPAIDGAPLGHHNVFFSNNAAQEFRQIEAGQLADDPTIYACISSLTDAESGPCR